MRRNEKFSNSFCNSENRKKKFIFKQSVFFLLRFCFNLNRVNLMLMDFKKTFLRFQNII